MNKLTQVIDDRDVIELIKTIVSETNNSYVNTAIQKI